MPDSRPILFFDSGVGGLSVLAPTQRLLPRAPIVYAADLLGRGRADAMLAIGVDTLTDTVIDAYRDLGLTGARGYALSEAAVSLVLERSADARRRGAPYRNRDNRQAGTAPDPRARQSPPPPAPHAGRGRFP